MTKNQALASSKNDLKKALLYTKRALALDQRNDAAHAIQGEIYWGNGDLDQAEKEFTIATNLKPNIASYHRNLCHLLCAKKDTEAARKSQEAALKLEGLSKQNKLMNLILKDRSKSIAENLSGPPTTQITLKEHCFPNYIKKRCRACTSQIPIRHQG